MNSEVIYSKSGSHGSFQVSIDGLRTLMSFLKQANPELQQAMRKGLKEAVSDPVLPDARRRANAIADDGTFAASLSITSRANGSSWLLKSDDEAGPVKEFARKGARTRSSKGTPRADARLRMRSGVGVPLRANPPRAMVPAVNENIDEIKSRIDEALAKVLEV